MDGFDRRTVLAGGVSLFALARLPARAAAQDRNGPPVARVGPVDDVYHGVRVTDPYRWMESGQDRDWLPYLRGQADHARSEIDRIPGRRGLLDRISALTAETASTGWVVEADGRLFYEQRMVGGQQLKLFVREGEATRLLIDPETMREGDAHVSLDWWSVSPDGGRVAYGLSPAGSEASVLHLMEVASGQLLPDRIPMTDRGYTQWLPDSAAFLYHQLTGARGTPLLYQNSVMKLHRIGADPASDPVLMGIGRDPAVEIGPIQSPLIEFDPASRHVLAEISDSRPETVFYVAERDAVLAGRAQWRKLTTAEDEVVSATLLADTIYLVSNKGHERGRVIAVPADARSLDGARELIAESELVVRRVAATRDGIVVSKLDGGIDRHSRIGRDGRVSEIALPFEGNTDVMLPSPYRESVFITASSWLEPRGVYRLSPDGSFTGTRLQPRPPIDLAPYIAERRFAPARDGVRIPYTIVRRRNARMDGRNPTLLDAYGAYGSSMTPFFNLRLIPFLDAGGAYVMANVRGGGEYGRPWHRAGQKEHKANTWNDAIAVAEQLIRERVTSSANLAMIGTSAGGVAVGRAVTERPDLFAAAIANVGFMNPIRYIAEQNVADIEEWGPPVDERSFRIMLAMDSYHAVRDGVRYPAVLGVTGINDPHAASFHTAKFIARLQAATASEQPVMMRVDFDAGHGIGSTRAQTDATWADIYAFALWRTGAPGFQPTG